MTCNEVSLFYIICGFDRFIAESQVGDSNTTGFLGVILEVCLNLLVCMVTDDFNGVLVCTNSTVCTQTPELASLCAGRGNVRIFGRCKGKVSDIVSNGNSELFLRCI